MQVQIEFWQLVGGVVAVVVMFASVMWLFGTILVKQFKTQLDQRFVTIQADLTKRANEDAEVAKQLRQFEKDFSAFQISLPLHYVRREDYIRGQTVIESKLDALYSKLEVVQIQGAKHG
jgi:cobalamin biosynthesis Co2+ chelatase CbiK